MSDAIRGLKARFDVVMMIIVYFLHYQFAVNNRAIELRSLYFLRLIDEHQ